MTFRVGDRVTLATTAYDRNLPQLFKIPKGKMVEIQKFEYVCDRKAAAPLHTVAHVTDGSVLAVVNVSLLRRI